VIAEISRFAEGATVIDGAQKSPSTGLGLKEEGEAVG